MTPLRTKIAALGGSACIAIPLTLAKMFDWAPGAVVRARLVENGAWFERDVRDLYSGRASGIIIPKDVLAAHGLPTAAPYGEVDVPFYEWVTATPAVWPKAGLIGQRRRAADHRRAAPKTGRR